MHHALEQVGAGGAEGTEKCDDAQPQPKCHTSITAAIWPFDFPATAPSAMPKKSIKSKTKAKPQPEPSQRHAIERLLQAKDYAAAIGRLRPLVQRFPDHSGLRRSLVQALHEGQGQQAAAVAAYEWAERRPNSLMAQEHLLGYAIGGSHLMLADRVAARIHALGGKTRNFPLSDTEKAEICTTPDGSRADEEAMVQFDIAKLYISGARFAEAAQRLEQLDLLSARNNRAICLFHLSRLDEALSAFLDAWQRDGDNLLALGWAAMLRLYRDDAGGASGLCTTLAAATARRADDANLPLIALLLLDRPEEAWNFYQRAVGCEWWEGIHDRSAALMTHLGACAAARVGHTSEARRLWKAVSDAFPNATPASANLAAATGRSPDAEAPLSMLEAENVLPIGILHRLRDHPDQAQDILPGLDAASAYLNALYLNGSSRMRQIVRIILLQRLTHQDTGAAELLRGYLRLNIGTPEERQQMLSSLREHGMLGDEDQVEFWDGNEMRQLTLFSMEIHREPSDSGLPPDLDRLLEESIIAHGERRYGDAEAALEAILESVPDHPTALSNLAALRDIDGRPDEAKRLLQRALELDPDYLFARCNLARRRILDGDLDAADALLAGQGDQRRIHIQDLINLYGTLAMLNAAKGQNDEARALLDTLQPMIANDDEARRLTDARRLAIQASPDGSFLRALFADMMKRE